SFRFYSIPAVVFFFSSSGHHQALHSFPTRRSSDLFGGCTFCSITEHEGRIIQSRSEDSVLREIEAVRDNVPGFTGVISDLGGPRSEEHTSELQSLRHLVCRLLLEKKKKYKNRHIKE